jgi:hypothetical protein
MKDFGLTQFGYDRQMTPLASWRLVLLFVPVVLAACGGEPPPNQESPAETAQEEATSPGVSPPDTAGVAAAGEIAGFVFDDSDRNGTFDGSDARMPEQTVVLTNPASTEQIRSVTTDSTGAFRFDGLTPGDYRITLEIPDGFQRTNDVSMVLSVRESEPLGEVRFGIAPRKP